MKGEIRFSPSYKQKGNHMSVNKTQKATATIGLALVASLGIFFAVQYKSPDVPVKPIPVHVPIQKQCTSATCIIPSLIIVPEKKHVYNPSPSVPCDIGKSDRCSAVFTVNGKRTDYSE
jgi:hypothetical protein